MRGVQGSTRTAHLKFETLNVQLLGSEDFHLVSLRKSTVAPDHREEHLDSGGNP